MAIDAIDIVTTTDFNDTEKALITQNEATVRRASIKDMIKRYTVNDLTTGGTDKNLSAEQGKVLNNKITENSNKIGVLSSSMDNVNTQLSENTQQIANKVDKITGKGLSTNDYDNTEKAEVAKVKNKADITYVDTKFGNMGNFKTFKGSCLFANLPTTGMAVDDYWYVTDKTTNYCWNGTAWIDIGNNVNIGDNTITEFKIADLLSADLLSWANAETGGYYGWNYVWTANASKNVSARIPVEYLDVIRFDIKNANYKELVAFDSTGKCIYYNSSILNAVKVHYLTVTDKRWAYIAIQSDITWNNSIFNSIKKFTTPNWYSYLYNKKINSLASSVSDLEKGLVWNYIEHSSYQLGTYSGTTPAFTDNGLNVYKIFDVVEGEKIRIHPYGNPYITVYFCTDDTGTYISGTSYNVTTYDNTVQYLTIPAGATKLYLACEKNRMDYSYIEKYGINKNPNQWFGKSAVIFGTSIPAGMGAGIKNLDTTINRENSYPLLMGHYLGLNITNEAVGSSGVCCRKISLVNATTNPYGFMSNFEGVSRCLTNTIEQMTWIANWIDYKINGGTYANSGTFDSSVFTSSLPTTWTSTDTGYIKSYSYENKLVSKHLGSNRKDLYIFEHGHNDMNSDNFTTDTTGANGMFSYSGCMNFLINLILNDNPRANIVIMSHYDNQRHTGANSIITAQKNVADYWEIPFLSLYDKLGLSQRTIKTTGYWDTTGYTDGSAWWVPSGGAEQTITMLNLWIPDNTHPHLDKSGKANRRIARIASQELKKVWF